MGEGELRAALERHAPKLSDDLLLALEAGQEVIEGSHITGATRYVWRRARTIAVPGPEGFGWLVLPPPGVHVRDALTAPFEQ
jgi:hypothetical protein